MTEGAVRREDDGRIVRLTFDRPEKNNALTWTMYRELAEHCDKLREETDVQVVVLQGAGERSFVAGTDIGQFIGFETAEDALAYEQDMAQVLGNLENLPVPTIAAINGYAVGGGLAIAALCDLRLCTTQSRFGLPVARTLGNCVPISTYARLSHLIGPAHVKELIFTAALINAERAREMGFVMDVVVPEEFNERVSELAQSIASHAPLTLQVTKEALRRLEPDSLPDGEDLLRLCYGSRDFREGVRAFLDKRTPQWEGR